MKHKKWKIHSSKIVFEQLPWLRVFSEVVELPDGRRVEGYLKLEAPDFVMVVPINHNHEIGLIRSYKHGIKGIDLQPPAGYLKDQEDSLDAAKRELLEETGCTTQDWQSLGNYAISGNQGYGLAYFFLAVQCTPIAEPNPGDLEVQEVLWIPIAEVKELWKAGRFLQLSSIAIIGLALRHLECNINKW